MMGWQMAALDIIHNAKTLEEAREMAKAALVLAGAMDSSPPSDTSYFETAKNILAAHKQAVLSLQRKP